MNAAAEVIYDLVDPTANLIFGAVIDPSLSGQVSCSSGSCIMLILQHFSSRALVSSILLVNPLSKCLSFSLNRLI